MHEGGADSVEIRLASIPATELRPWRLCARPHRPLWQTVLRSVSVPATDRESPSPVSARRRKPFLRRCSAVWPDRLRHERRHFPTRCRHRGSRPVCATDGSAEMHAEAADPVLGGRFVFVQLFGEIERRLEAILRQTICRCADATRRASCRRPTCRVWTRGQLRSGQCGSSGMILENPTHGFKRRIFDRGKPIRRGPMAADGQMGRIGRRITY